MDNGSDASGRDSDSARLSGQEEGLAEFFVGKNLEFKYPIADDTSKNGQSFGIVKSTVIGSNNKGEVVLQVDGVEELIYLFPKEIQRILDGYIDPNSTPELPLIDFDLGSGNNWKKLRLL